MFRSSSPHPAGGLRRLRALVLGLGLLLSAALCGGLPLPERLRLPGSAVLLDDRGQVLHAWLAPDQRWRIPVSLERVDPELLRALVAIEDSRYHWHPGVDPLAILRALAQNAAAGSVRSGASTLTMQVIRMAEPRPRTLRSKAVEALRALQLEARWSKDHILEAWLQLAPYGRNLEGVEVGSWALFGHGADALSPAEIAVLIAIPQDPARRRPDRHPLALREARDALARRLVAEGVWEPRQAEEVFQAELPTALRPLPRHAPHAARWLRSRAGGELRIQSRLQRGVQALVESKVEALRPEAALHSVRNAAVIVVERQSGAVVALVGGFSHPEPVDGAEIAAFTVPRSPGSALKPFLYERAIARGLALPQTLVEDLPRSFAGYRPQNYDGSFAGMVRLEEALSQSLNLPFVDLLADSGVERFLGLLRSLGANSLSAEPGHYGLSLVAGGVELSPLELAALYFVLAEGGLARPLDFGGPGPAPRGLPVLDPGASWLTRRALSLRDRPDFPSRRRLGGGRADLWWKTGTSFGNRDAWAAGGTSRYVAVVWVGNLDQRGSAWLIGASAAAPLLFDVLEGLERGRAPLPDPQPEELIEVELCAISGRLPTDACPHRSPALALEDRVPAERCALHERVEVDLQSGLELRPGCREGRERRWESRLSWPAEVRRFRRIAPEEARRPLHPDCERHGGELSITLPPPGMTVLLLPGLSAEQQELQLLAGGRGQGALSWFVDGRYLGQGSADEAAWWAPQLGTHTISVTDQAGNTAAVEVQVLPYGGRR